MERTANVRAERTRERLRQAAFRLFVRQGYQATSIEAILAEANISSKETLYRHYHNKEAIFADVIGHLTLEQPGFVARLAALPEPRDLVSLRQALTRLCHEIVAMIDQPGYLLLVRMVFAESVRFPQLSALFFSTVTQRGIALFLALFRSARAHQVIAADLDLDALTRTLLGGLVASVLISVLLKGDRDRALHVQHADAVADIVMRALTSSR